MAPDCVGERMGENARLLIGNYKEQKDSVIRPYEAVVYHLNNMGEPAEKEEDRYFVCQE